MTEIVDENGKINYEQALHDLKTFLYGRKGRVDRKIHSADRHFYFRHIPLLLRSFSLSFIRKVFTLWLDMGYDTLHRYIQLNVIGILNKLKERQEERRGQNER